MKEMGVKRCPPKTEKWIYVMKKIDLLHNNHRLFCLRFLNKTTPI